MKSNEMRFILCIKNDGCEDLEIRKLYQAMPDPTAEVENYLRVIDESGEDYLYPKDYFVELTISRSAVEMIKFPNITNFSD